MNTQKKKGLYLMLVGAGVLAGALLFVYFGGGITPTGRVATSTATSTAPSASIRDMEPLIPEAKVSTEGWKTCRNEEYGYEFKFPAEWHIYGADAIGEPNALGKRNFVRESEECNGASVGLSPTTLNGSVNFEVGIGIEVYTSDRQYPFADIYSLAEQKKDRAKQHFMLLDKHDALLQLYAGLYGTHWYVTSWHNENTYRLAGENFDDNEQTVTTILSTFRFLDTATTSETTVSE